MRRPVGVAGLGQSPLFSDENNPLCYRPTVLAARERGASAKLVAGAMSAAKRLPIDGFLFGRNDSFRRSDLPPI